MVLFYDDEHQVTKAPPTGWRKYLRRLIKVVVIFAVLLVITMWVLSTAGGNSKALKLGIQDYLTDATGYLAELTTLESMEFFPVTHIQFSGLTLHRPVMKEKTPGQIADEEERRQNSGEIPQLKGVSDYYDAGETVARIDGADVRMNFWDMFFSRRRFYVLDVKGVTIEEAILLPRRLQLDTLRVDQDRDFPAIIAQGHYGDYPLDISIRTKKAARGVYEIPDVTQFQLHIGPLQAEGIIDTGGRASRTEFTSLRIGNRSFTGHITMKEVFSATDVEIVLQTGHSALKADLAFGDKNVKGTVTASILDPSDVKELWAAYNELQALWGSPTNDRIAFGSLNADVRLNIEKLVRADGQENRGNVKADLITQPYLFQLNNITGLIDGGALKGDFSLDATGTGDAQMKADLSLRGWDYARQAADKVTGQADMYLRAQSAGKTFDALKKNIKGEWVVVGGEGTLTPDTALYNGSNILNTMLNGRDQALTMQCLFADFKIDGPQAIAQDLLMDMQDMSVSGAGAIQLDDLSWDMKLTPTLKKNSAIDRAVAVNVKADKVTATGVPTTTKRGDSLAGSIDTAFSAFSLSDLGLNEAHPCHAYLKKP